MSREIKFRAWDSRSLKWFDMSTFEIHHDCIVVRIPGMDSFAVIKEGYVLMQFTGLRDSKGVEIYEGDIVKAYVDDENGYAVTKVWYMAPQYLLANYTSGKLDGSFDMADWGAGEMVDDFEVIGNIYEHPYLLGGEKYTAMHYGEVK